MQHSSDFSRLTLLRLAASRSSEGPAPREMAKPCSNDLRRKFLQSYDRGKQVFGEKEILQPGGLRRSKGLDKKTIA